MINRICIIVHSIVCEHRFFASSFDSYAFLTWRTDNSSSFHFLFTQ